MVVINPIVAGRGLDIGSAPSTARDDSVGEGLRNLGRAVQGAGDVAMSHSLRLEQQKLKMAEFAAEQEWQRTQLGIAARYAETKQNIDPSGAGFTETVNKQFIQQYDEFLKTVPDALKPKFSELVATDQEGRMLQAAADEVAQRNTWYEVGINETVNRAQTEVAAYPQLFGQKLADVHRTIEASGLPAAKQEDLKRSAEQMLGVAWFERMVRDDPAFAKTQLGVGDTGQDAYFAAIRAAESGGNDSAKNPNSSATGRYQFTDGTWARLMKAYPEAQLTADGRTDPAQQERAIRLFTAENESALRTAGIEVTNSSRYAAHFLGAGSAKTVLQAPDRAAMSSVVDAAVIKANPFLAEMTVADFKAWAARKSGGVTAGNGEPAPQVASLPFNERLKLYDQAVSAEKAMMSAEATQAKVAYDAEKGRLELGIELGEVASKQTILDAPLDDSDKAVLLNKLETQQNRNAAAQSVLDAYNAGTAGAANPFDGDQRKVVSDAYDLLMKATPDEQRNAATVKFVETMGVVPPPVVAAVRRNLAANDAAMVAAGLSQAAGLYDVAPNGLAAVEHGKELTDAAATFRELVTERGLTVEQAAGEVIRNRDPAQRQKADVLDKAWKQAVKDEVFRTDDVLAQFDGGLFVGRPAGGVTPAQEAALNADYLAAAERHFKGDANGDSDLARQMAVAEMKQTYGVSETSGGRALMKYPPELFYPARAGGHGYIRDLALQDARTVSPEASNIMLVSTPETAADVRAGRAPRYDLFYQRADGVWDMIPDQFTVGAPDLTSLDALDSEEREIQFALQRQEQEWRAANPRAPAAAGGLAPLLQMAGEAVTGAGFRPDPALTQRLEDVRRRRVEMLGQTGPQMATSDPLDAERRWLETQAQTFGMMGGSAQ